MGIYETVINVNFLKHPQFKTWFYFSILQVCSNPLLLSLLLTLRDLRVIMINTNYFSAQKERKMKRNIASCKTVTFAAELK
jgi:hypothetical protein